MIWACWLCVVWFSLIVLSGLVAHYLSAKQNRLWNQATVFKGLDTGTLFLIAFALPIAPFATVTAPFYLISYLGKRARKKQTQINVPKAQVVK